MRVIGWIDVDLETNGRGLPSRCLADLAGRAVLARAVEGALACPSLREVAVTCAPRDRDAVSAAVAGLPCRVIAGEAPDLPDRALRRRARKWAGHSWRGGIGSTYVFDEEGNLGRLYAALAATEATHGVKFSASGPFIDAAMVEGQIAHLAALAGAHDVCLSSAPPGLNYEVYGRETARRLATARDTIRTSLAISGVQVTPDPASLDYWYPLDVDVVAAAVRLLADSARGEALVRGLVEAKGLAILRAPAKEVLAAVAERPDLVAWRLPEEITLEVCFHPGVASDLRPLTWKDRVPGGDAAAAIASAAAQVADAGADDLRWTFGSVGDPLDDSMFCLSLPEWRPRDAYGLHLSTSELGLRTDRVAELISGGLDVISVELTAATAEGYAKLHRANSNEFNRIVAVVEELVAARRGGVPFVLVEWVKVKEQEGEWEAFYDRWAGKADGVVVRGFCDYAGQVADRAIMHLLPGRRGVCERLQRRMTILPNGDVTLCEMDYLGRHAIGNVHRDRLEDLWRGRFAEVRHAHARGEFGAFPLCPTCKDWGAL